jgi:hypothetical protein
MAHEVLVDFLAACARYIGAEYPRERQPPVPRVSQMAVLGAPEARANLLQQLRKRDGSV